MNSSTKLDHLKKGLNWMKNNKGTKLRTKLIQKIIREPKWTKVTN